jgi:ferredoxin
MAKYVIQFDRDGCIGAGSCVATSGNWQMGDDNKANVLKKEFDEKDLAENKEAAEACPVGAITIINTETGDRVV